MGTGTTPSETPPRAWGRRRPRGHGHLARGNTPTGVGKTLKSDSSRMSRRKHPHGRGEDRDVWSAARDQMETPPRAWGRLCKRHRLRVVTGNTPTGVGKTMASLMAASRSKKHPHGRGEDGIRPRPYQQKEETPPRAWGRLRAMIKIAVVERNTPTGVGKTRKIWNQRCQWRKHPHGRGEDSYAETGRKALEETPPRAWGRLPSLANPVNMNGNTPTGVGKTWPTTPELTTTQKHPHGRGED